MIFDESIEETSLQTILDKIGVFWPLENSNQISTGTVSE
jgi:hypothetical protein